ncbi:GST3 [Symbiodinium natans]|uniref:GST3 protein n=1 Tax=Symbiodinium natans TaxID=878477 RepID=A0A812KC81_9DINO|nr:GST3 [Symbiodinium natans]
MNKNSCTMDSCQKVFRQLEHVLWSWWTDIPWLNLDVARRMFAQHEKLKLKDVTSWRKVAQGINFPRFEYVAYQMWTMLHEGRVLGSQPQEEFE